MSKKTTRIRELEPDAASDPSKTNEADCERIAAKAYELYLKRGQSGGHDIKDWLEAERQVAGDRRSELG